MSEIPADVMKTATDIAYSAEIGVVVGTLPGAIYIARAILAERERCIKAVIDAANAGKYTPLSELAAAIRGDQ